MKFFMYLSSYLFLNRISSYFRRAKFSHLEVSREDNQINLSQIWRIYNLEVLYNLDPGKDFVNVHQSLVDSLMKVLHSQPIHAENITVVKKAFDGRWKIKGQPKWIYTVDVSLSPQLVKKAKLKEVPAKTVKLDKLTLKSSVLQSNTAIRKLINNPKIIIVGAGPSGLYAAITLVKAGFHPIIIERGFPVETRGRDIGALFNRKILNEESNLCYGEGGAGTWSDGKLTTRIGKNSEDVRDVLQTLIIHGAPERILIDGKPHLGTDRLVRILKDMRKWLEEKGAVFRFGTCVQDIIIGSQNEVLDRKNNASNSSASRITGLVLSSGESVHADAVVLAVGHSARALYATLAARGVHLVPKPFAVGFRVEHPQELIDRAQYGVEIASQTRNGAGRAPVADYRLAAQVHDESAIDGERACYSFCMCPGGQIVPTSVRPDELCVNGMSFSRRQSPFANSALVVGVTPEDLGFGVHTHDPLVGVAWQRDMERCAAVMGGGALVAPVQRVTDFLAEVPTPVNGGAYVSEFCTAIPGGMGGRIASSYRLGVRGAACHTLYPEFITRALQKALLAFDKQIPNFISPDGILHGVETRTSSPVQILRNSDTLECLNVAGLYPTGEGAGYAGGIVSAAVDGVKVARRIIEEISS